MSEAASPRAVEGVSLLQAALLSLQMAIRVHDRSPCVLVCLQFPLSIRTQSYGLRPILLNLMSLNGPIAK